MGVTSKAPSSSTATLKVVSLSEAFFKNTTRTCAKTRGTRHEARHEAGRGRGGKGRGKGLA